MKKFVILISLLVPVNIFTLSQYDVARLLFFGFGGLRGYAYENTGPRHILYFLVGACCFDPFCYYSVAHGIGSTVARIQYKMKEESKPTHRAIIVYKNNCLQ